MDEVGLSALLLRVFKTTTVNAGFSVVKRVSDERAVHAALRMCFGVARWLFNERNIRLGRQEMKWVNFPPDAAYTAEAKGLYELIDCSTDAPALDDLVLQAIEGVRTNNGNAPSVFEQTFEALICTRAA